MNDISVDRENEVDSLSILVPQHIKYSKFNIFAAKKFKQKAKKNGGLSSTSTLPSNVNSSDPYNYNIGSETRPKGKVKEYVDKSMKTVFRTFKDQFEKIADKDGPEVMDL